MAEIDALTARLDDLATPRRGARQPATRRGARPPAARRPRRQDDPRVLRGPAIRTTAVALLVASGRDALHYREWFDLLTQAGHEVAGKDPLAVFLTQITRSPAVRKGARPGEYVLDRGRACHAAAAPGRPQPAPRDPAPADHRPDRAPHPPCAADRRDHQAREGARGGAGGMTIRPATAADAEQVVAIYNHGIAERQATFETRPRTRRRGRWSWLDGARPVPGRRRRTTRPRLRPRLRLLHPRGVRGSGGAHRVRLAGRARPQRRLHAAGRARRRRRAARATTSSRAGCSPPTRPLGRCTARRASRRSASSAATRSSTAAGSTRSWWSACSVRHATTIRPP